MAEPRASLPPTPTWTVDGDACWHLVGRDYRIWLAPRPAYCDRGRWLAHVEPQPGVWSDLDAADGWPRYYFDLDRAQLECAAWLQLREHLPARRRRGGADGDADGPRLRINPRAVEVD